MNRIDLASLLVFMSSSGPSFRFLHCSSELISSFPISLLDSLTLSSPFQIAFVNVTNSTDVYASSGLFNIAPNATALSSLSQPFSQSEFASISESDVYPTDSSLSLYLSQVPPPEATLSQQPRRVPSPPLLRAARVQLPREERGLPLLAESSITTMLWEVFWSVRWVWQSSSSLVSL